MNLAFCRACNIGEKYVLEYSADIVLFLNTDSEADANPVTELVMYHMQATLGALCYEVALHRPRGADPRTFAFAIQDFEASYKD
ncbi:MAG: hypothetical protein ILP18_08985 [Treponema sp.]|nr:hypothetical protein [Treponema sp.]